MVAVLSWKKEVANIDLQGEMKSHQHHFSTPRSAYKSSYPNIAGYDILGELGRGGMGVVYKAREHKLDRLVAIKTIGDDQKDPEVKRRFLREMRAAARLTHPNIITVYDSGVVDGVYFLVMEFVAGTDLERLVLDSGPLAIEDACDYVRQAALGLQHAHEQGLVHRDIKPANLIVAQENGAPGAVKILDMGLARIHWSEGESSLSHLTREGTILGTPEYMAPEQVDNSHSVDIRADLYSLGCTFYFLLTGWVPFRGRSVLEILDRHRWARPTLIERIRREVPRALGEIVRKLMAKRPEERYQTPAEFVAHLDRVRQELRGGTDRSDPAQEGAPVLEARTVDQEFECLQFALADQLEGDRLPEARGILDAMFRLKPNDPLALAVRAFLDVQQALLEPVGECRRFEGHGDWVWSVAFSPDGKTILSAGGDKTLQLWDAQMGVKLRSFLGHKDAVKCAVFSANGQRALSCGKDRTVRLWDVATGRELRSYLGHASGVEAVALSPDGRQLVSCGGKSVRIWEVERGQPLRRFAGHDGEVKSAVFCPDGKHLASGGWDHCVRLWETDTGRERRRLDGVMNLFTSVAVSPDGQKVLGAGSDAVIHLWDMKTGRELQRLVGHTDWVTSAAFSPDGSRVISGSHDLTVRLWDVETGRDLHCFNGHTNWVNCVALSPDGRYAVSGSADNTVRLWRLPR